MLECLTSAMIKNKVEKNKNLKVYFSLSDIINSRLTLE